MLTTLYCSPQIDARVHQSVQSRIYSHPMTNEYSKKWNLHICSYQHWFEQICGRIEEAIYKIQYLDEGWHRKDDVMRFSNALIESLSHVNACFRAFILSCSGRFPITVLKRRCIFQFLMNLLLRGTMIQIFGKIITWFIKDGLVGEMKFGLIDQRMKEMRDTKRILLIQMSVLILVLVWIKQMQMQILQTTNIHGAIE